MTAAFELKRWLERLSLSARKIEELVMQAMVVLGGIFDMPMHPILVHFTSALIPLSFLNDLLARIMKRHSLAVTGWWMLFYGALITPTTAAAGWWWSRKLLAQGEDQWEMQYHMWTGFSLAVVLVAWTFWRWRWYRHGHLPGWGYLAATFVLVAAVVVQGHLGGMMSFGE